MKELFDLGFANPKLTVNLKNRGFTVDDFTTCFNYFNSCENTINIEFESAAGGNKLVIGIAFDHCKQHCQYIAIYVLQYADIGNAARAK